LKCDFRGRERERERKREREKERKRKKERKIKNSSRDLQNNIQQRLQLLDHLQRTKLSSV
jgi:hypothetical protein